MKKLKADAVPSIFVYQAHSARRRPFREVERNNNPQFEKRSCLSTPPTNIKEEENGNETRPQTLDIETQTTLDNYEILKMRWEIDKLSQEKQALEQALGRVFNKDQMEVLLRSSGRVQEWSDEQQRKPFISILAVEQAGMKC